MKKNKLILIILLSICVYIPQVVSAQSATLNYAILGSQVSGPSLVGTQTVFNAWGDAGSYSMEIDWNNDFVADETVSLSTAQWSSYARSGLIYRTFPQARGYKINYRVVGQPVWRSLVHVSFSSDPNVYREYTYTICNDESCSWTSVYPNLYTTALVADTLIPDCAYGGQSWSRTITRDNIPRSSLVSSGSHCSPGLLPSEPVITGVNTAVAGQSTGAISVLAYDSESDHPEFQTIMYDIDWDGNGTVDGTTGYVQSGTAVSIGNIYSSPGTYTVRARSRDSTGMISAWSTQNFTITVTGTNAAPNTPTLGGTTSVDTGVATANTVVATDPEGDQVFYELDWDGNGTVDGSTQTTPGPTASGTIVPIGRTFSVAGTYQVQARAVQANDVTKRSNWASLTITVTVPAVPNTAPNAPTLGGTTTVVLGVATANTVVATDPEGQTLTYEIDWDNNGTVDGTTTAAASGTVVPIGRTYPAVGTYQVRARAVDAPGLRSAWSSPYTITVTAPIAPNTAPNTPTLDGSTTGFVSVPVALTVVATDPEGHTLSYQLDWDNNGTVDGTTTSAPSGTTVNFSGTFSAAGTYQVRARAVDALGLMSGWSVVHTITVTVPPVNQAPNTPTLGGTTDAVINIATANTVVATDPEGDQVFYELDWDGNGTVDGSTQTTPGATASGATVNIGHTYTTVGTYNVRGRAVQANDLTKRSGWATLTISVTPVACVANRGDACNPANACGQTGTAGVIQCDGSCSVTAPANPPGYGNACSSAANVCGERNTGNIQCNGSCSAVQPSDMSCTPSISDFRASPRILANGKQARLSWTITGNPTTCSITYTTLASNSPQPVLSSVPATGTQSTTPVTEKRFYTLRCTGTERTVEVSPFSMSEI
jgi:hypothetical protein